MSQPQSVTVRVMRFRSAKRGNGRHVMVEAFVVAILIGSAGLAFAVGRWWTIFIPIALLGALYAGLNAGWWGSGLGNRWQVAMAFVMGAGVLAALTGLAARSLVKPQVEQRAFSQTPH